MQVTWFWSLSWEDPLEKERETHSRIFAWRTPWTEEPGGLQSMGSQRVGHDWVTKFHFRFNLSLLWWKNLICLAELGMWIFTYSEKTYSVCFALLALFFFWQYWFLDLLKIKGKKNYIIILSLIQFSSVGQSCPALCDSTPGLPVHH